MALALHTVHKWYKTLTASVLIKPIPNSLIVSNWTPVVIFACLYAIKFAGITIAESPACH